ncbi:glutathione synthase [Saccharospirillum sp. MSK14-1]|uniref:glutathione synthase n=1 Tax=Saccharospirillum sp. MSK14-1 TaxID=1897632 RepID=UPI000D3865A0|nr:glutathione synthase [Saccharospirillum sp. MSK14-1]PTY38020.1 glutathione synthase [Saccharospirillum sp. MSK14-1]
MSLNIGVVMDPIEAVTYKKDSTLAMLWAAQDRGWNIHYMTMTDLYLDNGKPLATTRPLQVHRDPEHFYDLGDATTSALADLDVILMRKDPPFDNEYIYATYMLERAEEAGVLIVNKPQALRDCNEKFYATAFADFTPPHVITRDAARLKAFHQEHGDVIFKPLDGMGGSSIFRLKADDPNVSVIIETLTDHGQQQTMAQKYLPEIKDGDKRILMIDGEPIDYCLARLPAKGETRGNLAAGGTGRAQPLSERDRAIAEHIGPELKKRGLIFVGLDVIGDYVTEINVTSPTCIREIDNAYDTDIAGKLMDVIAAKRGLN